MLFFSSSFRLARFHAQDAPKLREVNQARDEFDKSAADLQKADKNADGPNGVCSLCEKAML